MNHPDIANHNAKARHTHMIEAAVAHRQATAVMGPKPTSWPVLHNLIRQWLPAPERREQVPGPLEAERTA